jgi:hypothetical protein
MQVATELERLVVVETKLDALIEQNKTMVGKLDDLLGNYVPRAEYDKDLEILRGEIEQAKRRSALQTWVTGSLSAIFGAVMAILIQGYFSN